MSMAPSPANAPPFLGPTPPDRVQMSMADHCQAILAYLRTGQVTPEDFMVLRGFEEAKNALLEELAGQNGQPQPPAPDDHGQAVDAYDDPNAPSPTYTE